MSLTDSPPATDKRRKRAPRFVEIATRAGVSMATVNRVLNERGGVSPLLTERVIAAARELGVPRVLPTTHRGVTRLDVLLVKSPTPYFARLERAWQLHAQALSPGVVIHLLRVSEKEALRHLGARTQGHPRDGLVVALHDSEPIRAALRQEVARGVPVVTLMSGVRAVPGLRYAGIDNWQAGRTAGHVIGRTAQGPGTVLLLTNALSFRAHAERVGGCTEALLQRFPALRPTDPVSCEDDADRAQMALRQAVSQAARDGTRLAGLYSSGAGTAGIAAWLSRLPPEDRPVWVAHELSDEHRTHMAEGLLEMVIDQDPDGQVAVALQHLLHACGHVEAPASNAPNPFRLYCRENMAMQPYLP
ncbi:LacI family DNA-binding transcriptional regulator [Aquabacterium sp.]|uniref:LacI family DNA-binding transcriptional regulator n=1 Tax=Aquabacterium sp. TaxID=1872578 RepID=UPI0025C0065C|nr:LacI family DNA-binding transcriptional regulator [Aquabacterium sp.]